MVLLVILIVTLLQLVKQLANLMEIINIIAKDTIEANTISLVNTKLTFLYRLMLPDYIIYICIFKIQLNA